MTRSASEIGAGLLAARAPRHIAAGERIHVIGAGGAGASAAALLAHHAGALVSCCDAGGGSAYTAALDAAGIPMEEGHSPAHVAGIDRIAVQLPGVQNSAEVIRILGKTASLEFRLADEENNAYEAARQKLIPNLSLSVSPAHMQAYVSAAAKIRRYTYRPEMEWASTNS